MPNFPKGLTEEQKRIYRNKTRKRNYQSRITWEHKYREWTEDEIKLVMEHGIPDRELAEKIHRTIQAIQTRRSVEKNGSMCN